MPEVARSYGIGIKIFFGDHPPPHFHAIYGENNALVNIETLEVFEGDLPIRAEKLVLEWATLYQIELLHMWNSQEFFDTRPSFTTGILGSSTQLNLKSPCGSSLTIRPFMQRIHQSVQFKPEVLISPSFTLISERGSGMPYRTKKYFDFISVLFKTYYAMFFLVFATQYFVRYAVLLEFQRRTYFILNATLRGFQPG
jgi:Domain of unknown function (DUF4160)